MNDWPARGHTPSARWWQIGTRVVDDNGKQGMVVIRWNDGNIWAIENVPAHPNPTPVMVAHRIPS